MRFFLRWVITAIAVALAILIVPGITVWSNAIIAVAVTSIVLAFLNVFIKPFLQFLSCGFMIITFGLFTLVINAFLLWLAAWVSQLFGIHFIVDGFWPAFWGGLVISIVTWILSVFIGPSQPESTYQASSTTRPPTQY